MSTTIQPERKAARTGGASAALRYQSGLASEFATEALPGALPVGQNSPQRCAYGLYAEQISGTAFTAPRHANRRTWFYRIRPGAHHKPFKRIDNGLLTSDFAAAAATDLTNDRRLIPVPFARTVRVSYQALIGRLSDAHRAAFRRTDGRPSRTRTMLNADRAIDTMTISHEPESFDRARGSKQDLRVALHC